MQIYTDSRNYLIYARLGPGVNRWNREFEHVSRKLVVEAPTARTNLRT